MKTVFEQISKFIPFIIFGTFGIVLVLIGVSLYFSNGSIEQLKSYQILKEQEAKDLLSKTMELSTKLNQFVQEREELNSLIIKLSSLVK